MSRSISIIVNSYNPSHQQSHMTMACLADIRKFTEEPYELIVVESPGTHGVRDDYGVLRLADDVIYIKNKANRNVYANYHQGAKKASGELFFFIQSDVYVHERTINKLAAYLDKYDAVFPQQIPITRSQVLDIYQLADGELADIGQRDAGLIGITREAYFRCGGWDTRFKNLLGEKAFYIRWGNNNVSWTDKTNAFVSHIMGGSNWLKEHSLWEKQMKYDAKLITKHYE